MTDNNNPFSAIDSTLGYLYQVRSALLWSLQRLKNESDFTVSIETLDDVTFATTGGEATDLLQTKHHRSGVASLTDACPDLWKTLRIWFEGHLSRQLPVNAHLYLVTTGIAATGSAASSLRETGRDVAKALQALDATASTSTNQNNQEAYKAYLSASPEIRFSILDKIMIKDAAPLINDLDSALRQEIFWAVGKEQHISFLARLEGWWLRRVLKQLCNANHDRIGGVEIDSQMADLREQFKQESLPIDDDLLDFYLDDATKIAHENFTFVKQLEIIVAGKGRIAAAIRDYYRAYKQRSRWLRDDLVIDLDLHKYEKRLIEEWELIFQAMCDELGEAETKEVKAKAARSVLLWAETTTIPIRPNVTEPFVTRGSLHMLADEMRIGWHPEFRDLLAAIL